MIELDDKVVQPKMTFSTNRVDGSVNYNVIFKPKSEPDFTFNAEFDIKFTDIVNIENITNIVIKVNGVEKFNGIDFTTPIVVSAGDSIYIKINKNFNSTGKFTLLGNII